jgi:hypothetical protein
MTIAFLVAGLGSLLDGGVAGFGMKCVFRRTAASATVSEENAIGYIRRDLELNPGEPTALGIGDDPSTLGELSQRIRVDFGMKFTGRRMQTERAVAARKFKNVGGLHFHDVTTPKCPGGQADLGPEAAANGGFSCKPLV